MQHLERALDNQNQWWKYLLVLLIGSIAGQFIGAIPLIIVIAIKAVQNGGAMPTPTNSFDLAAYGIDPNFGLALMILPFLVSLFVAIILIKAFHKRSLKEVINGRTQIRWKRIGSGFLIWGIIICVITAIDISINPNNFNLQFDLRAFIPLVIVAVLLLPFQAATEEFLFRGYLAQGIAGWTKNRWVVILIPSIAFALLHAANPEVKEFGFWVMMPHYLLFGLTFGIISVLDDGIEIAIGIHVANNVLSAILVTNKASVLQTPALFEQLEINPQKEFWFFLATTIILLVFLKYKYKWDLSILSKRVKPLNIE